MPNDEWFKSLADELHGVPDSELVSYLLKYLIEHQRGAAFLAWLRAEREVERRAR